MGKKENDQTSEVLLAFIHPWFSISLSVNSIPLIHMSTTLKILAPKSTRVWQASDGSQHGTEKAAQLQELRIATRKNILEFVPKGGDMRLSAGDLADILMTRPQIFIELLQAVKRKNS
jgi:hypothetical protein